jgi:hypothetical protein
MIYTYIYIHIYNISYIYTYILIYVCVCVCVCVRERVRVYECMCDYTSLKKGFPVKGLISQSFFFGGLQNSLSY